MPTLHDVAIVQKTLPSFMINAFGDAGIRFASRLFLFHANIIVDTPYFLISIVFKTNTNATAENLFKPPVTQWINEAPKGAFKVRGRIA